MLGPHSLNNIELSDRTTLTVDGQAVIFAIGKSQHTATPFNCSLLQAGCDFMRIDSFITGIMRSQSRVEPERDESKDRNQLVIENRDIRLPAKWETFISYLNN